MGDLLAFLGVSAAVICTPGQDTALTIRNTLIGGRAGGVRTALGVCSGQILWALAAATGVAALLAASEVAFNALKLAGAGYLVFLGAQSLLAAVTGRAGQFAAAEGRLGRARRQRPYRQGILSDLGNPKMAVFFTGLLPQFVPAHGPAFLTMLALGVAFAAFTFTWLVIYAVAVARARRALARPRVRRTLDAVMGTALVALGVRLAVERRAA